MVCGPAVDLDSEAARILDGELLAVERDVQGGTAGSAAAPASESSADAELVFRVERKGVPDEHPAAGAERQAVDVPILREPSGRTVGGLRRRRRAIADCATADLHRRGHVALDE